MLLKFDGRRASIRIFLTKIILGSLTGTRSGLRSLKRILVCFRATRSTMMIFSRHEPVTSVQLIFHCGTHWIFFFLLILFSTPFSLFFSFARNKLNFAQYFEIIFTLLFIFFFFFFFGNFLFTWFKCIFCWVFYLISRSMEATKLLTQLIN